MNFCDEQMDDFSLNGSVDDLGMEIHDHSYLDDYNGTINVFDPTDDPLHDLLNQDDHISGIIDDSSFFFEDNLGQIDIDQITFTRIYTDSEIARLKEDVSDCEYDVSRLKSEVHHHENLVSLVNTPKGQESGDLYDELDDLAKAKSQYEDAKSKLENAKAKLNNAT
jgi:hypothetical protein